MTRTEALTAFAALDTAAIFAEMQQRGIATHDYDAACQWVSKVLDRITKTSAATLATMTDWREVLDHASGKHKRERTAAELPADIEGGWYRIEWNGPADRVQVVFDKYPGAQACQIVKAAGFYWAPTLKCWSRRITRKAERAAYDVAAQLAALR